MKIGGVSNLTSFLPKKIGLIFDFDVSLKFAEELLKPKPKHIPQTQHNSFKG